VSGPGPGSAGERGEGREPSPPGLSIREYRAVFDAAPDGILLVDDRGVIREANLEACSLFRTAREDLVGREVERLIPSRLRDAHRRERDAYMEDPRVRPMGVGLELVARRADGTDFPVEISLSPTTVRGSRCVIAIVRDVTERKLLRRFGTSAIQIAEEERQRIARELHDDTAQSLSSLLLRLRVLAREVEGPARGLIEELRDGLLETAENVRRIARGLRPPALDDAGLEAAIRSHVHRIERRDRAEIRLDLAPVGELLTEQGRLAAYRVTQEALSNAVRHAEADRITVRTFREDGRVVVEIEDDGVGFENVRPTALQGRGLGLVGMYERMSSLGGRLELRSRAGEGTRVRAVFPQGAGGTRAAGSDAGPATGGPTRHEPEV